METKYQNAFGASISTPVPFTAPSLTAADLATMSADQIGNAENLPFLTDQQLKDDAGIPKGSTKYQKYHERYQQLKIEERIEAQKEKLEALRTETTTLKQNPKYSDKIKTADDIAKMDETQQQDLAKRL